MALRTRIVSGAHVMNVCDLVAFITSGKLFPTFWTVTKIRCISWTSNQIKSQSNLVLPVYWIDPDTSCQEGTNHVGHYAILICVAIENDIIALFIFHSLKIDTVQTVHYFVFLHKLVAAKVITVDMTSLGGHPTDKGRRIQHHLNILLLV